MKTNSTTIDNRNMDEANEYLEARVEALTQYIRVLEELLREKQGEAAD